MSQHLQVMGPSCSNLLLGLLKPLAELRDSYKFSYNTELEYAVGAAIRAMGPETVLGVISLKVINKNSITFLKYSQLSSCSILIWFHFNRNNKCIDNSYK